MKIITLTLAPAFDTHCKAECFTAGIENFADITSYDAGGKGINLSRALLAGGCVSLAIVALGKENRASFLSALDTDGLEYVAIEVDGRIRENITVHPKEGKETRLSFSGFSADDSLVDKVKDIICKNAESGDIVTIVGSIPSGITKEKIKAFAKGLKTSGMKVVIDSRSFTPEDIIDCSPFLIKPNEQEISAYTDAKISSLDDAEKVALEIMRKGVDNVMISLGASGAVLASHDGVFSVKAPKISVRSTIGAGDSSIAGFLAAYIEGKGSAECLKTAIAYGSAACMTEGTKPPRKEDIKNLLLKIGF